LAAQTTPPRGGIAAKNIETIAQLEAELLRERSRSEILADTIAGFAGKMSFVYLHLAGFASWVLWNMGLLGLPVFDPFPFVLLTLAVSFEAVLLSTFVLIKQNRSARASERRNRLNLQVDILSEQEITKVIQMLQLISDHLGVGEVQADQEAREFSQRTALEQIAKELDHEMPGE
jgi:uncharacterized membrane protein